MENTTAEGMGGAPSAEQQAADMKRAMKPVVDALHDTLLVGLGLVTVAGEQGGKLVKSLMEKGREMEPNLIDQSRKAGQEVSRAMEDVGAKLRSMAGKGAGRAEAALDEKVQAVLQRSGFPSREEIESLTRKMDELNAKLSAMQGQPKQE